MLDKTVLRHWTSSLALLILTVCLLPDRWTDCLPSCKPPWLTDGLIDGIRHADGIVSKSRSASICMERSFRSEIKWNGSSHWKMFRKKVIASEVILPWVPFGYFFNSEERWSHESEWQLHRRGSLSRVRRSQVRRKVKNPLWYPG